MNSRPIKILALSDVIVSFVYSPQVRKRFAEADLIVGCGDLAYYYIEYVLNALDRPCYFVRGNHDKVVEYSIEAQRTAPAGAVNIHRQVINHDGLLLAGVEGSLRYRMGPYQYTQNEMWQNVLRLVPKLLVNRQRFGRYLDVFITHAPPAGIHDMPDLPHRGIDAFRWALRVFKPTYHIHGHIHLYRPDTQAETIFGETTVINAFSYREISIEINHPIGAQRFKKQGRNDV